MSSKKIACCKECLQAVIDTPINPKREIPLKQFRWQPNVVPTNPGYTAQFSPNPLWNLA